MKSVNEIELLRCPKCEGRAVFKRYQPERKVFAVHVACVCCGLRTQGSYVEGVPPADTWEGYHEQANLWNERQLKSQVIHLGEPDAWQEFDGEGGYGYVAYEGNENRREAFRARNPSPTYTDWVEPLYSLSTIRAALSPLGVQAVEVGNRTDAGASSLADCGHQAEALSEALKGFRAAQQAMGGCTDGGCIIEKPKGMHTNGGCKCVKDFELQRMVRAAMSLASAAEAALGQQAK